MKTASNISSDVNWFFIGTDIDVKYLNFLCQYWIRSSDVPRQLVFSNSSSFNFYVCIIHLLKFSLIWERNFAFLLLVFLNSWTGKVVPCGDQNSWCMKTEFHGEHGTVQHYQCDTASICGSTNMTFNFNTTTCKSFNITQKPNQVIPVIY